MSSAPPTPLSAEHPLTTGANHWVHAAATPSSRGQSWPPWLPAIVLATALGIAYLVAAPPSADLAAATYRANLFSRAGMTLWDNGWYAGHHLLAYSVLSPALSALVGVRVLLVLCTVVAAVFFAAIAIETFGPRAGAAAGAWFAVSLGGEMLSGRVPYELGLALALAALLALQRERLAVALPLALLSSLASPVAGAFLALAGLTLALAGEGRRGARQGLSLSVAAIVPILLLALAFPEGGYEPFAPGAFWPQLAAVVVIALVMPRKWRALRVGTALYAVALAGAYAVHTPVGGNAERLGPLLVGPLAAGLLWDRHRRLLALLAPVLLYWQLSTPVGDLLKLRGDPSVNPSYYAPVAVELQRLTGGSPTRVEVPMTGAHWESSFLPEAGGLPGTRGLLLARGWERQLDTRHAGLFYAQRLTPRAYLEWLDENSVAYVALPDVRLDEAGREEGALIRRGLPFLRERWHSRNWRLYSVLGSAALASPPAHLSALGVDSFTLQVPRSGSYEVRVRFTPYWALTAGFGCVREAPGGWSAITASRAGQVRVAVAFSAARVFDHGPRCH